MEINNLLFRTSGFLSAKTAAPDYKNTKATAGSFTTRKIIWLLVGLGIFFRIFHFLDNRSLWTDEIYLATSLINKGFLELATTPLDYEQKAPIGFLWLVKLAVVLFGKGEMALRLIPFITGIVALFLFVPVARFFLKPLGVVLALALLALAPPIIYHSVEIKQYGPELLVTIAALYLYTIYSKKTDYGSLVSWGLWGAAMLWFSYTAIFVLAGMAMGISLYYLLNKEWPVFFRSLIPFTLWLISFGLNYFLFTFKHADASWLVTFFAYYNGFMPLPPASVTDLNWFVQASLKMLYDPLGLLWNLTTIENAVLRESLKVPLLPMVFLAVGLLYFFRKNKKTFLILLFPVILHLLASGLKLYPFMERFILFSAPLLILFIAAGGQKIISYIPEGSKWRLVLPVLLLAVPTVRSVAQVADPALFGGYKKSTQREGLLYINEHYQPGDAVYVYWNARHAYQFYKNAYNLKYEAIKGQDVRFRSQNTEDYFKNLTPDFAGLAGKKRIWVIYNSKQDIDIGDFINRIPAWYTTQVMGGDKLREAIGQYGKEISTYETLDVNVSLFELSGK